MKCLYCKGTKILWMTEFVTTPSNDIKDWFGDKAPHSCPYCHGTGKMTIKSIWGWWWFYHAPDFIVSKWISKSERNNK